LSLVMGPLTRGVLVQVVAQRRPSLTKVVAGVVGRSRSAVRVGPTRARATARGVRGLGVPSLSASCWTDVSSPPGRWARCPTGCEEEVASVDLPASVVDMERVLRCGGGLAAVVRGQRIALGL
jgi:hypothetical protein